MATKDRTTIETTIALPEALHTRVRVTALRSRVSMRRWIQEAIEARLAALREQKASACL